MMIEDARPWKSSNVLHNAEMFISVFSLHMCIVNALQFVSCIWERERELKGVIFNSLNGTPSILPLWRPFCAFENPTRPKPDAKNCIVESMR